MADLTKKGITPADNYFQKKLGDVIDALTGDQVFDNVSTGPEVIDNLTTDEAAKALSAAQGVALKALVDAAGLPFDLAYGRVSLHSAGMVQGDIRFKDDFVLTIQKSATESSLVFKTAAEDLHSDNAVMIVNSISNNRIVNAVPYAPFGSYLGFQVYCYDNSGALQSSMTISYIIIKPKA